MTLRHLRIFVRVCQNQNVTQTAKDLHLSQPAVSQAIRELEEYYQVSLFDRISRKLYITTAGEHLLTEALFLLDRFDQMNRTMKDWDSKGEIRIGSSVTIGSELMPTLVSKFQNSHPNLSIYVHINSSDAIEEALINHQLDIALIEGTIHSPLLSFVDFFEDELGVYCAEDHPLGNNTEITPDILRAEKLLLRDRKSGTREIVEAVLQLEKHQIQPYWESTSTHALLHAAQQGLGVAILSKFMVAGYTHHTGLVSLNMPQFPLKRPFRIVYFREKTLHETLADFIQLCHQITNLPGAISSIEDSQ